MSGKRREEIQCDIKARHWGHPCHVQVLDFIHQRSTQLGAVLGIGGQLGDSWGGLEDKSKRAGENRRRIWEI